MWIDIDILLHSQLTELNGTINNDVNPLLFLNRIKF